MDNKAERGMVNAYGPEVVESFMRLRRPIFAALAAAVLALPASALSGPAYAATFQNGSFEGIVEGWTADPTWVQTPPSFVHRDATGAAVHEYLPVDGFLLGVLTPGDPPNPFIISQTFSTVGGLFSGWAAFSAGAAALGNDAAFVRLTGPDGVRELFGADIATVGDFGHTPWIQFSTVLTAGDYLFEAGVIDVSTGIDFFDPSFLILDGITMAEVPEPGTWALMLTGFFGLGALLRRRRHQSVRTPGSNA
jgi:hypothetical protein